MPKNQVINEQMVFTFHGLAYAIGTLYRYIQEDGAVLYYASVEYAGQKEPSKYICNEKGTLYEGRSGPKEFEEFRRQIRAIDDQFNNLHATSEYWENIKKESE